MRDRSFKLGVVNGVLFEGTMGLMSPGMVMSAFFLRITGSTVFASLPMTLMYLGWIWPQLFISNFAESRERKKPIYLVGGSLRSTALTGMGLLAFTLGENPSGWFVWVFPALYFMYCSAGGVGGVAFMDVVAKTVPPTRRGFFWGLRGFFAGILGIASGFYVRHMLGDSGPGFPTSYALLFCTAVPFITAAFLAFAAIEEPVTTEGRPRTPFRQYLAEGMAIFRDDRNYRLLFYSRALISLATMGQVVFIPYAIKALGLAEAIVGVLVMVATAFALPTNFLWSRIADRSGNRLLLLTAIGGYLLAPPLALASYYVPAVPLNLPGLGPTDLRGVVFIAAFVLAVTMSRGYWMGAMNYLLEISPEDRRPSYQAFVSVLSAPFTLVPVLAGWVAQVATFRATFVASGAFTLCMLLVIHRLGEPRKGDSVQ